MKHIIFILIIFCHFFSSCYDDKGNYDYKNVNEIEINVPKNVYYRVPRQDSVEVFVVPTVSQSMEKTTTSIKYHWEIQGEGTGIYTTWIEAGEGDTCKIWMKPTNDTKQKLRLTLSDESKDGTLWYKEIMLVPVFPYSRCWFVLQDANGSCQLGAVDGVGEEASVIENVFKAEDGLSLNIEGKPLLLTNNLFYGDDAVNPAMPMFTILTENDAQVFAAANFEKLWDAKQMLLSLSNKGVESFKLESFHSQSQGGNGDLFINDGQAYLANADGYSIFYPLALEAGSEKSMNISHYAPLGSNNYYVFDKANRRFLRIFNTLDYNISGMNQVIRMGYDFLYENDKVLNNIQLIPQTEQDKFNPENIDQDIDILQMGLEEDDKILAFGWSNKQSKLIVYELNDNGFNDENESCCSAYFELSLPTDANPKDLSFATSYVYNRIFFFAAKNGIYKVDLNRTIPQITELYKADNLAEFSQLQFKLNYTEYGGYNEEMGEWESYDLMHQLGAVIKYSENEYGIIDLLLNASGNVSKAENSINLYSGFRLPIVGICYNVQ